ncbi:MAG: hypothetical protein ABI627_05210 [Polyangiaceae bacterium]
MTAAAANGRSDKPIRNSALSVWVLLLLSAASIATLRPRLVKHFQAVVSTSDDYLLPPTDQAVSLSLGYRSALADMIYAHVLVSYGIHFQEKRNFEFVGNYLDTVNALDPKFRDPYRFADTLLTIQPVAVPERSYYKAKEILERGLKALPYDTELWNSTGQFLAYIAAPRLTNPAEAAAWRLDGARKLARACELAGNNENVPYHCINAATLLSEAGEQAAMNKFLNRFLMVNDDPQVRSLAIAALRRSSPAESHGMDERVLRLQAAWTKDLPFVTRTALFVVGPRTDTAACAGTTHAGSPACASSWRDWSELHDDASNTEQ